MKNTDGGALLLVKLQAEACNFTKLTLLLRCLPHFLIAQIIPDRAIGLILRFSFRNFINLYQESVVFHIETSHLI